LSYAIACKEQAHRYAQTLVELGSYDSTVKLDTTGKKNGDRTLKVDETLGELDRVHEPVSRGVEVAGVVVIDSGFVCTFVVVVMLVIQRTHAQITIAVGIVVVDSGGGNSGHRMDFLVGFPTGAGGCTLYYMLHTGVKRSKF